jgi:hypothetical protein
MYISAATRPIGRDDLHSILLVSRRNNAAQELTGILLAHENRFFQVIEGPKDAVYGCLHRIKHDPRHDSIMRLHSGNTNYRSFPQWRMGFALPADLPEDQRDTAINIHEMVRPAWTDRGFDPEVRAMLRNFLASFRFLRQGVPAHLP